MKFKRQMMDEPLDISFIPLIDVLLVIVIFLAAATSFTKVRQLNVSLPQANINQVPEKTNDIILSLSAVNQLSINNVAFLGQRPEEIAQALRGISTKEQTNRIVLYADGKASHQAVIDVMEGARLAGIERINFATRLQGQ